MHRCLLTKHHQCYLCPRNPRAQGDNNPDYKETFVFVNDYSAVKEVQQDYEPEPNSSSEGAQTLLDRSSSDYHLRSDPQ